MSTYTRRAFSGLLLIGFGLFFANVFSYVLRLILTRNLTVAEYGLVYATLAFFGIIGLFKDIGFAQALSKFANKYFVKKDWRKLRETVLAGSITLIILSLALSALVALNASWIAEHYLGNILAANIILIYALRFALTPINSITLSLSNSFSRFDLNSLFTVIQSATLLGGTILFLQLGLGVAAPFWAYLLLIAIELLINVPLTLRSCKALKGSYNFPGKERFAELSKFAFPVALAGVGGIILGHIDTTMLTAMAGLEEVGIYQVAKPTAQLLLIFGTIFATVLFPIISELWEKKKKKLIKQALNEILVYGMICMAPLIAVYVAYPDIIINLLFGGKFIIGGSILQILALAAIFSFLYIVLGSVGAAIGKPAMNTWAVGTGAIVNVIFNLALIPLYGGAGAAAASLIATCAIFFVMAYFLKKEVHMSIPFRRWAKTGMGALLFLGILALGRVPIGDMYLRILTSTILGGLIYIGFLFLTQTLKISELKALAKRVLLRE